MTFRQVLEIVWRRRLLVAVTTVLVLAAAFLYARLAPVSYQAIAVIRYSPAGTSTLLGSASYGPINLDIDPEYLQSPELAARAAQMLNEDPAALQAAVSTELKEGQRIIQLRVMATGSSPTQARDRANGVSQAFVGHVNEQLQAGISGLNKELKSQEKIRASSSRILAKNPGNQSASADFSASSGRIAEIQQQITAIRGSGAPVTVSQPAGMGLREGVSFLTIMLIGFTSGLLAGAGVALIRDQFDDHVRSTEDVEDVIGDHVIGDVATVPRRQLKLAPLPVATRLPTPLNESIRGLRTSLEVIFPQRHVAIVMTSAEPGEGKTFVSVNLAVAMARAGRSVILVEADLRRPRVHTYFDLPHDTSGFADMVESGASTDEMNAALLETPYPGLRILPAGSSKLEPADLLARDVLGGVLDRLRGLADFVLLDSPPGLALTDAAILGRGADGVLVITALNRTRGSALRGTLQLLNSNRVNVVGVVVNRSRRATVKSYGRYYHDGRGVHQPSEMADSDHHDDSAEAVFSVGADSAQAAPGDSAVLAEARAEPDVYKAESGDLPIAPEVSESDRAAEEPHPETEPDSGSREAEESPPPYGHGTDRPGGRN